MPLTFEVRGVVEGFYGTPWSHADRLDMLSFLGEHGMNAYAYAPKDDAKHRSAWRDRYDARELRRFGELVSHADAAGVRFGYAIAPGLDVDYTCEADRRALLDKLARVGDTGTSWFLVLFDDIPGRAELGSVQGELVMWLVDALGDALDDVRVTICPTEYVGTRPSAYLARLHDALPPAVDVMWTGPTVCSPTIRTDDARAFSKAVGARPVLVWDNYPVNDGPMAQALHLGPYQGRDPGLAAVVSGVLCNPMIQPQASKVALATAAEFLAGPEGYDTDAAWARALEAVGERRAPALAALAAACADGPLAPPATLPLAQAVDELEDALAGAGWVAPLAAVADALRAARALPATFAPPPVAVGADADRAAVGAGTDPLGAEVGPWADAARREAQAGLAAGRLLQRLRPVATTGGGAGDRGRAAGVEAQLALEAAFGMLFSWAAARTNNLVVFGPRFAIYPAVVQLDDGSAGLDARLAVREDANVIDRLCRLALREYEAWRARGRGPLRVWVDDELRRVDGSGCFELGADDRSATLRVACGPLETSLTPDAQLPFREPRLT